MSKFKLPLLLVILAAFSMPALAGEKVVKRVPAGAVAFHFVADLSYVTGELVGHIVFIEGVDGSLFAGAPSKDTAYFTLRITEPTPAPIFFPTPPDPLLPLVTLLGPGAQFTVYFDPEPTGRPWTDPKTFGDPLFPEYGMPIAVFEESALLGTGISGTSFNVFSSRLIDSTPIDFDGQRIDFKKLVPNGVTTTNFTRARADGARFGATSIAIGGKLRDKSDDDD